MRSLRTAQILASRSLLLSARSTTPRPPPLRWPLGKELPLVPSSRALQRWIAGAVSFSLTFTMAAAAEVRARSGCPQIYCRRTSCSTSTRLSPSATRNEKDGEVVATLCGVVERVDKLVYLRTLRVRYKPEVGDIIVGRVIEIAPKRWRLDINFSQDAVLMLSSMNLPDGIQPINDMDFIRQSKVDVTTWSQAIATYDVPHP